MFDMMNMFGKVKEMQANLQKAKDNLQNITAEGESGGGMVKAKVNGQFKLLKLEIDSSLVKPEDLEMLQDLCVAAVNKAMESVAEKSKDEMKKATEGVMPNIPGLDLNSLFGAR
ncbi:MAG: YbaB/EbfC family nucleoid-associated protein [Opitutaceae bacterium]|nr:YbaB/EbfC family nucleoid-associated protein [Cytophagales bacterium]